MHPQDRRNWASSRLSRNRRYVYNALLSTFTARFARVARIVLELAAVYGTDVIELLESYRPIDLGILRALGDDRFRRGPSQKTSSLNVVIPSKFFPLGRLALWAFDDSYTSIENNMPLEFGDLSSATAK
jgi:hypothetical protein